MPPAARLGDICTGHECFPPRANVEGPPNVYVNGSVLASGSSTVYVNGKQAGRIGDPVACGSTVATESGNVFAGG